VNPIDLVAPIIGSLFVAVGAAAAAAALSARPRINQSAAWFAVFCVLYGTRMLARSMLVHVVTGWPEVAFAYVTADITYAIGTPATLFVESIVGPGRHALIRRTWQLLAVCGAGAIAFDIIVGRPFAAIGINAPLVTLSVGVWAWHFATQSPRGRWSPEVRAVAAAAAIVAATALFETLFDNGLFGEVVVEPLSMLVFAGALGWFVLTRARQQEFSYAALSRELELARSIQQSLLPQRMPDVPGLRLDGAYLPMSAVAGDFYEILPLANGRALVLVADVSGHGIPAALVASMVKVAVAAAADRHDTPGGILSAINRSLTGKFERAYVTACCIVIDSRQQKVMYAAAGHPPALLRRADGRVELLDKGGVILTLLPSVSYDTEEVSFDPGDRLLVYTDGLTEATRQHGDEFFGDRELARIVSSTPVSDDLLRTVLDAHRRWIGEGTAVSDDISVVVIESVEQAMPA
jgi:sigma-B regulation protein RsbU (phosphoserine phosphatase)